MTRVKGRFTFVADMTFQEIAEIEGTSPQRIWELEQRAFKKIRKYLFDRFGNDVTMEDIFPYLGKDNVYEQMQVM